MKHLVVYLTSCLPDKQFTIDVALALKENGVDSLELGIPFSDPVADGAVIQEANLLSLEQGFKMEHLFEISQQIGQSIDTLWMGYANPFYRKGFDFYLQKAQAYGVSGFIIPDIPHEEALSLNASFKNNNVALINFVAPTDSEERIKKVVSQASKFIYLVAYAGITGAAKEEDLSSVINFIRSASDTPVYLGFGVNKDNAREKAQNVDGVIVGSAFVKILLDSTLTNPEKHSKICALAREIKDKINS